MELKRFGVGDWVYCQEQLARAKLRMADASELMRDIIDKGKIEHSEHVRSGAWASEAFLIFDEQVYGVRAEFNPLILPEYASQAVEAHKSGKEFYSDNIKIDGTPLRDLIVGVADVERRKPLYERRVVKLTEQESYNSPSDKLWQGEVAIWSAGGRELAKEYGGAISQYGISNANVNLPPRDGRDIVRSFWLDFHAKNNWSGIGCSYWFPDLVCGSVFGVSA